ncbi:MAG: bifunctional diaminohydroxyphosphoribosylaminopyrimidine deaminase/5-amino-6-(5-phosphoribosylamino)uracil reductase RibD [candidate division Zixibacteria bacterium]
MADDRLYRDMMRRAIRLARWAQGYTSPNPAVGAVLFNDDGIISKGYHKKAGLAHAEIVAIEKAGEKARGASIAVSLEPCCHTGRTGPCTQAIVKAGIKRVIYAVKDPNCKVNGGGREYLQEHGIEVISDVCREEAYKLNEEYFHFHKTGRPFVVLKMAQTLDGRIATATGESQWISGIKVRTFAHQLRARYDAVAVGSGTVRADNPSLTVRHVRGKNPYRIILTVSGQLPANLNLFINNNDNKTVVAAPANILKTIDFSHVTTWSIRKLKSGLDIKGLLNKAGKAGLMSILFEGGSQIATELFNKRLVNKFYLSCSPILIGEGIESIGALGIKEISGSIKFKDSSFRKMGTDILFSGYPVW